MNRKGFTLIELLAVILILGIIALIAIPTVNKVVKKARERASEASIINYVDAVEKASSIEMLNENASLSSVTLDIAVLNTKIDISGTLPTSGSATLDDNRMVSSATFCINNYVVIYSDSKARVDNTKNCIDATTTTDETVDLLNGATPVLGTGLIPVTIENNGIVTYADTDKVWYDYENKKWANAVILSGGSYKVGDVISNDDIQSYFVWIPRYKYRLWNTGTAIKNDHSIDIVFESKDVTPSTGSNNGEYLTHPAFTTLDVNGIWVGKFETGYAGASTTAAAEVTANDSSKIIIKPNVFSWRNNTIYNMFMSSYNYNREIGSHMMKNTEWGAVAYLSHSKFGIDHEVNNNNNNSYRTGYSALPSTNQQAYPGEY